MSRPPLSRLSASLSDKLALTVLHMVSPETAHHAALWGLEKGLAGKRAAAADPILATTLWGLHFANPIGLAAGFDKDARVVDAMLRLGFGFVEAGTVTPLPQPGNAKPRLFRLDEDAAIINRFGFNSEGLDAFAARLARRRAGKKRAPGIVGANVGKNRDASDGVGDYVAGVEKVCGLADYLVVNISSPNTPGLRALQAKDQMENLIRRVVLARDRAAPDAKKPPLLVKLAPDLNDDELRDAADVALAEGLDGIILGNTTVDRPLSLKSPHKLETGGLSGAPLMAPSTERLGTLYRLTGGRIPLIGSGGIRSGADAFAKIRAGASLVQLYSAMIFDGPGIAATIARELAQLLRAAGFASVKDAVGSTHR